ncbi:MAG: 50S ribosomal protein L29 [Anaerolineae bacterium]|nr:50S ribosomal protein L29 [Anaerolineae bacterium]
MQASELRDLTSDKLKNRLQETRRELFNLRQQWYAGSLEDVNRIRHVRRDIARILTVLRERELLTENEDASSTEGGAA